MALAVANSIHARCSFRRACRITRRDWSDKLDRLFYASAILRRSPHQQLGQPVQVEAQDIGIIHESCTAQQQAIDYTATP